MLYGLRIASRRTGQRGKRNNSINPLLPLYQSFGNAVKGLSTSHKTAKEKNLHIDVGIIAHDIDLVRRTGIADLRSLFTTRHGGLNITSIANCGSML